MSTTSMTTGELAAILNRVGNLLRPVSITEIRAILDAYEALRQALAAAVAEVETARATRTYEEKLRNALRDDDKELSAAYFTLKAKLGPGREQVLLNLIIDNHRKLRVSLAAMVKELEPSMRGEEFLAMEAERDFYRALAEGVAKAYAEIEASNAQDASHTDLMGTEARASVRHMEAAIAACYKAVKEKS